MEIYIYYIYIFFLQISQSAANPAGQEREYLQKGSGSSLSYHMDQVCSCCCWILSEKKEERKEKNKQKTMLLEKIK